jgi:hypothetical protein
MGDFYECDRGYSDMTQAQLDACALEGGVVGGIGYGYATRGETPDRHGYGAVWVNSQGMGNHGTLVLVAKSRRAAEFLRTGRLNALVRDFGITRALAARIDDARKGVQYGREHLVVATVLANPHVEWSSFPGVGNGAARWAERWGIDGWLSCPRLEAAATIAAKLGEYPRATYQPQSERW